MAVLTALSAMIAMQRNEILRKLAPSSHSGVLLLTFAQQFATYVVLPTAVLLSRVFPDFGEAFARKLAPLLTLLR